MLLLNLIFEYQFLQNALIAGLLTSIVCGIIGVIIVEKKLVMMSGGIAHTAYGGVVVVNDIVGNLLVKGKLFGFQRQHFHILFKTA